MSSAGAESQRPKADRVSRGGVWAVVGACLLIGGCNDWLMHSWRNAFINPSEVGRFHRPSTVRTIRKAISIHDEPGGLPGATEPEEEDLVVQVSEAVINPGDGLLITILDLFAEGQEAVLQRLVNEVGYIRLPYIGPVKAAGLTPRQLELELMDQLKQGLIKDPQVHVALTMQVQRTFSIIGQVPRPGTYAIPRVDFRLLDAIALAGDIPEQAKTIYVLRRPPGPREVGPDAEMPFAPLGPEPEGPFLPADGMDAPTTGTARPPSRDEQSWRELMEAIAPPETAPGTEPADQQSTRPVLQPRSRWVWLNGEWVEIKPTATTAAAPTATQPTAAPPATAPTPEPVDWESLAEAETEGRILAVPAKPLKNGQQRYNIVIRSGDVLRVDAGQIGEFYLMGHVLRPGVYTLTGRDITVRQAIAAAGGLDQLAWPSRCELIRRVGPDREEITQLNLDRIFAGQDTDVFLKPNDVINVGTSVASPFLATIRNAFRVSYGFGFVYDRNFADIDSFSSQQNPNDRRRAERAQRFPGLFP